MRDKIAAAAERANRTMNAEIVSRLEFTFDLELTVHDDGFDFKHGVNSPEMVASFVRNKLGASEAAKPADNGVPVALEEWFKRIEGRLYALETKS